MHDDHPEQTTRDESTDSSVTAPLRERVERALRNVRDPDAGVDVFEAGLVDSITVDDGSVTVSASVAELDERTASGVTEAMLRGVRQVPGVDSATVEPVAPAADDLSGGVGAFDSVVAVASAKGGVGKSTVATGLACALAGDRSVGLFDADIHGPNVPGLLGVEGPVHSADDGSPLPVTCAGPDADLDVMSVGLMESGAPLAWRGAMAHDALTELYEETAWTADDTLVVDLPPGTGDVVLTTLQEVAVDGVVVVTTPFPSALEDTARSVELFRDNGVPVLGVVVNMAGFTCPSCGDSHELFPGEDPADRLDAPVLAEVPFSTDLQETPVPGAVATEFESLASDVAAAAAGAWDLDLPADAVDIRGDPPERRRARVREAFSALDPGEQFTLVSDRDPSPVREFLASLAETDSAAIEASVSRETPDDWLLTATHP
ncbi:P-loop NTPase [Salinirubrum litoreum]|uniref:Iron-sulfur cluster carrier protein n=1 Tax=Salinirubrum litoreum TaxID=1126234 RepID=A0ABD5RBX7_9EURY|nr:P-loop NTPase [Salinirubrum litoreum]